MVANGRGMSQRGQCQSVFVSHLHQAVIVRMVTLGLSAIWENFRQTIVSAGLNRAGLRKRSAGK